MYVMEAEDFGHEFLNDGLKLSPAADSEKMSESNIKEIRPHESNNTSQGKTQMPGKSYESDKNNSIEEHDSIDEDLHTNRGVEDIAGYNIQQERGIDSHRSAGEDGGAFSSDEEEQQASCVSCVPNTMRAVGNCLVQRHEFHEEMAEDPE